MRSITRAATFAILAAAAFAIAPRPASAAFSYTGGDLNSDQTYDGAGVDSTLDPHTFGTTSDADYIGHGATGSLSVISGTLTAVANDFKVARNNDQSVGTITVSNATFNIRQTNQWGGGIGVSSGTSTANVSGTVNVNAGGTLDWFLSGSSEQRMMIGNGNSHTTGTVNLNGGTFLIELDPTQALTDSTTGVRLGAGGGATGTLNLTAGTFETTGFLPFGLGGVWTGTNTGTTTPPTSPTFDYTTTTNAGTGHINITDGSFVQTGTDLFAVAPTSTINFSSGGTGSLSILNWTQSQFDALVTNGNILIDGNTATPASFAFSTDGSQGTYRLAAVPEPASALLLATGALALTRRRRRHA